MAKGRRACRPATIRFSSRRRLPPRQQNRAAWLAGAGHRLRAVGDNGRQDVAARRWQMIGDAGMKGVTVAATLAKRRSAHQARCRRK
jgi:hypothetical protein